MIFEHPAPSSHATDFGRTPPSTPQSHADWLEGESIRAYMATQRPMLYTTLIAVPMVFATLYRHVYLPGLLVWLVLSMLLACYRLWFTHHYVIHLAHADTTAQLQFHAKYAWTWPMTSALWGALVWLFYGKGPLLNQFIGWTSLACIGIFSVTVYAAHLKTMKNFINAMMAVMLSGMVWHFLMDSADATTSMAYPLLPFVLLFWLLLLLHGTRLNKTHLQRLELVKGNLELIDSLKEQTQRAMDAIATKNRFLASAAHDIRQPVLALDLYVSLLCNEPDMAAQLTPKIGLATKSVIEMFDSLFDLARLESGQLNINLTRIYVPDLMRDLELQYTAMAQAKNLELRLRTGNFEIMSDPQLLKRILGNLLMNAIKFTMTGGVLLACRPTPHGVRFEVWDTGMGIEPDQQIAVFKEFYKSPTHMGTNEGFGLGLSIVARLSEALGLDFSMQSKIGHGSVFCIEVPNFTE